MVNCHIGLSAAAEDVVVLVVIAVLVCLSECVCVLFTARVGCYYMRFEGTKGEQTKKINKKHSTL